MNWKIKALLQTAFSVLPFGDQMNYFCQTRVTKTLPPSDTHFRAAARAAQQHLEFIRTHSSKRISECTFLEFGGGATLEIPIAFYGFGANRQIVVDIKPLSRPEFLAHTIRKAQLLGHECGFVRAFQPAHNGPSSFGIDYRAPVDLCKSSSLEAGSIDVITSTSTMEHIPLDQIPLLLKECRRILSSSGLMSVDIDHKDHYYRSDRTITPYHFMKFTEPQWRLFNPSLHHQNRLRHSDFIKLFKDAGFAVLKTMVSGNTQENVDFLSKQPLAPEFSKYSLDDLAIQDSVTVVTPT